MQKKCDTCFYALMDKESEAPCVSCRGYSNYVDGFVYAPKSHGSQTLQECIDDWFKSKSDEDYSDFGGGSTLKDYPELNYNTVSKPKHYMLFEDQGIEVRDVIEKLSQKLWNTTGPDNSKKIPMFFADYVQMMQYVMRFMDKNGVEDLKKARWYLDKLIDAYEHNI
jgi:hypothetical protein